MSDIQSASIGFIAPVGDFGRHNSQITGSVNHLWKDFYAQALAEQSGTEDYATVDTAPTAKNENAEPRGGSEVLGTIVTQRHCDVQDTELRPPEALFLPIAEFELDLLPPPAEPFDAMTLIEQQRAMDFDLGWARPLVVNNQRLAA